LPSAFARRWAASASVFTCANVCSTTAGPGQFADLTLRFEPLARAEGFE
jgi:hypothetical protein